MVTGKFIDSRHCTKPLHYVNGFAHSNLWKVSFFSRAYHRHLFSCCLCRIAKATGARRSLGEFETSYGDSKRSAGAEHAPAEPSTSSHSLYKKERAEEEPFVSPQLQRSGETGWFGPPPLPKEILAAAESAPPPAPAQPSSDKPQRRISLPAINWEQFMGAKLFAWIGD